MRNKKHSGHLFVHKRGIVLLTTILMISALSLVVLVMMQAVYLYAKLSGQLAFQHDNFYRLERVAAMIEAELTTYIQKKCLIESPDPNALEPLEHRRCVISVDKQSFYYQISDMGEYPCLQLKVNHQWVASRHWLISVADDKNAMLQIRVVRPGQSANCHLAKKKLITRDRISWRFM